MWHILVPFGKDASGNEHSQPSQSSSSHPLLLSQGHHKPSTPSRATRDQEVQTDPEERRNEQDLTDYDNPPVMEWAGQPVGVSDTMKLVDPQLTLPPPIDPESLEVRVEPDMPLDTLGVHVSCQAPVSQSCCTCARSVKVDNACSLFGLGRSEAYVKLSCTDNMH